MYLKLIRESFPCGEIHRGKLYSVHFEPNEMGDYNEHLTLISEVYEIPDLQSPITNHQSPIGGVLPPPLIFPVAIRQCDGHKRLVFGLARQQSVLHLINRAARDAFFAELRSLILARIDVRMEVMNTKNRFSAEATLLSRLK